MIYVWYYHLLYSQTDCLPAGLEGFGVDGTFFNGLVSARKHLKLRSQLIKRDVIIWSIFVGVRKIFSTYHIFHSFVLYCTKSCRLWVIHQNLSLLDNQIYVPSKTWHYDVCHLRTGKHGIWCSLDVEECNFVDFWLQGRTPNGLCPLE